MASLLEAPDRILAYKIVLGDELYLVKFQGKSVTAARWMDADALEASGLVPLYKKQAGIDRPSTASSSLVLAEGKEDKVEADTVGHQDDGEEAAWRDSEPLAEGRTKPIAPYVFEADSKEAKPQWLNSTPAPAAASGSRLCDILPGSHSSLLIDTYLHWRSQPMTIPASTMVKHPAPCLNTVHADVILCTVSDYVCSASAQSAHEACGHSRAFELSISTGHVGSNGGRAFDVLSIVCCVTYLCDLV
jgi:hypothetical protein